MLDFRARQQQTDAVLAEARRPEVQRSHLAKKVGVPHAAAVALVLELGDLGGRDHHLHGVAVRAAGRVGVRAHHAPARGSRGLRRLGLPAAGERAADAAEPDDAEAGVYADDDETNGPVGVVIDSSSTGSPHAALSTPQKVVSNKGRRSVDTLLMTAHSKVLGIVSNATRGASETP
mgnify:CR=1 FL=1